MRSQNPTIIKIRGRVGNQEVVMFTNSGSTHNFLNPSIVNRGNILVHGGETVKVKMANGDLITIEQKCLELRFKMHGINFVNREHVLV